MRMPERLSTTLICGMLLLLLAAVPAAAQGEQPQSLDAALLYSVSDWDRPAVEALFRGMDWSSTRVFLLAAPITGAVAFAQSGEWPDLAPAYRIGMSQVIATGAAYGLKHVVRRPRPYETLDIVPRSFRYYEGKNSWSFPSAHATLAFATATSMSLSAGEWYVTIPALTWAGLVATSRVWLGVHYPSDVLVGAVIGTGSAVLVHAVADWITPSFMQRPDEPLTVVPLVIISW